MLKEVNIGTMVSDLKRICRGANLLDNALAIKGSTVATARPKIGEWI